MFFSATAKNKMCLKSIYLGYEREWLVRYLFLLNMSP